jgi:hypothetical protein
MSKIAIQNHFDQARKVATMIAGDLLTLPNRVFNAADSTGRSVDTFLTIFPAYCGFKAGGPLTGAGVAVVSTFASAALVGAGVKACDMIQGREETFKFFPSLAKNYEPAKRYPALL